MSSYIIQRNKIISFTSCINGIFITILYTCFWFISIIFKERKKFWSPLSYFRAINNEMLKRNNARYRPEKFVRPVRRFSFLKFAEFSISFLLSTSFLFFFPSSHSFPFILFVCVRVSLLSFFVRALLSSLLHLFKLTFFSLSLSRTLVLNRIAKN